MDSPDGHEQHRSGRKGGLCQPAKAITPDQNAGISGEQGRFRQTRRGGSKPSRVIRVGPAVNSRESIAVDPLRKRDAAITLNSDGA